MTDNKYSNYLQNAAKGARDAVSSATSLRNEPQKANNYTSKYTNGESKITSFLNSNRTAQSQGVLQSFGTGASYHNSGGMSANWDRNGSLDLSGTRKTADKIKTTWDRYEPLISNGLFAANNYGATSPQNMLNSLDVLSTNANRFVDNYGDIFVNAGLGSLTGQNNGITNPQSIADGIKNVWNSLNDNDSVLSQRIQDAASGANASVYHGITDPDEIEYLWLRYLSGLLKPIDETINMGLDNMGITKWLNVGATLANNGDYNTWLKYNGLIDNEAAKGYKKEFIFSDGINKRAVANKASAYLGGMGNVASGLGEFTLGGITGKHKLADDVLSLGSAYTAAMDEAAAQGLPYNQAKAMALSQVGKNLLKNEILSKTADFSDDILRFSNKVDVDNVKAKAVKNSIYNIESKNEEAYNDLKDNNITKLDFEKDEFVLSNTLNWESVVSKKGETRISHVMKHSVPNNNRKTHGVFNGQAVDMINDAWRMRDQVAPIPDGMGGEIYNIPYPNAGYESGYINTGVTMNYITIITLEKSNEIVAAFPSDGNYHK
ncbi:MAG: hypothetical protein IKV41_00570 [Oscillospiraceae bacterium]|nr:hypothetical protein [Oscillospiraceae bacterium]